MNLKDFIEEAIEMLPDNCSAEYFDDKCWYLEEDIISYLRSLAEEVEDSEED